MKRDHSFKNNKSFLGLILKEQLETKQNSIPWKLKMASQKIIKGDKTLLFCVQLCFVVSPNALGSGQEIRP